MKDEIWLACWQEGDDKPSICTMDEFCAANADDEYLCWKVRQLELQGTIGGGGGAAPTFLVTKLKLDRPDRASWGV